MAHFITFHEGLRSGVFRETARTGWLCWPSADRSEAKTRSSPHPSALSRPCLWPSEREPVRSAPLENRHQRRLEAVLTGRNGLGRAQTVTNWAGTALTDAVSTGLKGGSWCRVPTGAPWCSALHIAGPKLEQVQFRVQVGSHFFSGQTVLTDGSRSRAPPPPPPGSASVGDGA